MSKVTLLSKEETFVIITHHSHYDTPTTISRLLERHVSTICRFSSRRRANPFSSKALTKLKFVDKDCLVHPSTLRTDKKVVLDIQKDFNLIVLVCRIQQNSRKTSLLE